MYNKLHLNDGRIFHRRVDITRDRSTSRITKLQTGGCALHRTPAMESGLNSACTVLHAATKVSQRDTKEGVGCSQWHSALQPSTNWCQSHQGAGSCHVYPCRQRSGLGEEGGWVLANFLQTFSSFLGSFLYQKFYSPLFFSLLYILLSDLNSFPSFSFQFSFCRSCNTLGMAK